MTFDAATFDMLKTGIWETLFMTFTSSFFAYLIGIPLGIILIVTDKDGRFHGFRRFSAWPSTCFVRCRLSSF